MYVIFFRGEKKKKKSESSQGKGMDLLNLDGEAGGAYGDVIEGIEADEESPIAHHVSHKKKRK